MYPGRKSGSSPNRNNDSNPLANNVDNLSVSIIREVTGTKPAQIPPSTAEVNPEAAGIPPTPPMTSYDNTNFALFEEGYGRNGYIPPQLIDNEYGDELLDNEYPIESGNPI